MAVAIGTTQVKSQVCTESDGLTGGGAGGIEGEKLLKVIDARSRQYFGYKLARKVLI